VSFVEEDVFSTGGDTVLGETPFFIEPSSF